MCIKFVLLGLKISILNFEIEVMLFVYNFQSNFASINLLYKNQYYGKRLENQYQDLKYKIQYVQERAKFVV